MNKRELVLVSFRFGPTNCGIHNWTTTRFRGWNFDLESFRRAISLVEGAA